MPPTLAEIKKKLERQKAEAAALPISPKVKAQRLKRLKKLLKHAKDGDDIPRRDLKSALTENEWTDFESDNSQIGAAPDFFEERPKELDKYLEKLKYADFLDARAGVTPVTKRSKKDYLGRSGNKRLYHDAETAYERALEVLEEIFSSSTPQTIAQVESWLDRPFDYTFGGSVSADRGNVPRLKNSRSFYAKNVAGTSQDTKFDQRRRNKLT